MSKVNKFTPAEVEHYAKLARLTVTAQEKKVLAAGFNTTLEAVNKLNQVNTGKVGPTSQVTGQENVFREDVIDEARKLSQDQALQNTKRKYRGFFVVDQVLEQE